ncbi:hypothetical protein Cgig2_022079 [Carnegiea gigantea]|uniref:DUF4220 domain-containing protein n=1 Tax=Carnegiea gigantea TaxID=171969 RepID=A0A9Q1KPL7_9CARY|nr:hypothetical protein Cgig2_022079 [Carnegiea gigantea]
MENEWYIRLLVLCSLLFQVLLYLLAPLRRRTCSKWELCSISRVFSVCSWLPTFTLVLICCLAVVGHDDASDHNPPLLMWASLMLLHIAGLGQGREASYLLLTSDHVWERDGKSHTIVHSIYISMYKNFFQVEVFSGSSQRGGRFEQLRSTFSKLKCFRDLRKEVEDLSNLEVSFPYRVSSAVSDDQELITCVGKLFQVFLKLIWGNELTYSEHDYYGTFFLEMTPKDAIRMVEVEHKLIYDKFYGGVLPSESEIVIMVFLLPVIEAYSTCLSIPLLCSQIQNGFYKLDIFVDHFILCIHHFVVAYIWWMMWRAFQRKAMFTNLRGVDEVEPAIGREKFTDRIGNFILKELQLRIRAVGIDLTTRMIFSKGQWILEQTVNHMQGLSRGGELASMVWLCATHFGLVGNFYESSRCRQQGRPVRRRRLAHLESSSMISAPSEDIRIRGLTKSNRLERATSSSDLDDDEDIQSLTKRNRLDPQARISDRLDRLRPRISNRIASRVTLIHSKTISPSMNLEKNVSKTPDE